jgi:RNA polymerase sigma-70 factor (ECF subfamily)
MVAAHSPFRVTGHPAASGLAGEPNAMRSDVRLEQLYREHFDYVWRSARRLGVPLDEADDVVQETFLRARRLLATQSPQTPRPWLFSILYRVVQHSRRSDRRRRAGAGEALIAERVASPPARGPDASAEAGEAARVLEAILDTLDAEKRAVLVLAELEERTLGEIAEMLSINVNTAASRLRAARQEVEAGLARHRARDGWRLR